MLIFIHGPDTFRSREKLHGLIAEFKKKRDPQGFNVVRLEGGELTLERFRHEALSQGFLAPKRMVVVERLLERGTKEATNRIAEFIAAQPDLAGKEGNIIVFWEEGDAAGTGAEQGPARKSRGKPAKAKRTKAAGELRDLLLAQEYVFAFPLLDRAGLIQWLRARAKEQEADIEPAAVDRLVEFSGSDMWRLDRELSKLVALRKGKMIEVRDVAESGEGEVEPTGFAFTDAMAARSVPRSLRELEKLMVAGVEPLLIHGMLVRLFRTVSLVKSYLEDDRVPHKSNAAEELGLHPFVVKKTAPLVARFDWEEIREVYRRLLALDFKLKRQGDDPYLPLELFVMNLDALTFSSHSGVS